MQDYEEDMCGWFRGTFWSQCSMLCLVGSAAFKKEKKKKVGGKHKL